MRRNRQGKLQYYRRIPPDKRHLFENKAAFTAVLEVDPNKPTSKAAHSAWAAANTEFERRLATDTPANPAEDRATAPIVPLSPRDAAGIAAEPYEMCWLPPNRGVIPKNKRTWWRQWR